VVRAAPAAAKPFSATRITSARPCATELHSLLAEAGACFGVVLPLEDDGSVSSLARRLLGLTRTYARIMLGKFQRNQAFEPVSVCHLLDPMMRACAPARTGAELQVSGHGSDRLGTLDQELPDGRRNVVAGPKAPLQNVLEMSAADTEPTGQMGMT
jgi:hypothetical protein